MGDGVLAYFGYPRAHEDEAEQASAPRPTISLAPVYGWFTEGFDSPT